MRLQIIGGAVNVRVSPGFQNRLAAIAHRGERVALLRIGVDGHGQRWLRVGLRDGRSGWVASWYVARPERDR